MQLTVDRQELITALTEKRTEVSDRYQTIIDNVQTKIDALPPTDSVSDWFRKVADLVDADTARAEQQPMMAASRPPNHDGVHLFVRLINPRKKGSERIIPEFPQLHDQQRSFLMRDLKHAQERQARAVEPFDGALKILSMSSDDKVGITDGDYVSLLSGKRNRRQFEEDFGDGDEDLD